MITDRTPLSMSEAQEYVENMNENEELAGFMKKFSKLEPEKAKELKQKLQELELLKLKPEHIIKIVDILPDTDEDLNKIFADVTLNEDESKKILDTVKEFS